MHTFQPLVILVLLALMSFPLTCTAAQQETPAKPQQESTAFSNQEKVRTALDNLVSAYTAKNMSGFMAYVADDYTGDSMIFEGAIRSAFSRFHNIEIRYTFNNLTFTDKADKVSVGITFNRSQTIIKTGKISKQSGTTTLVFKLSDGVYKLHAMKKPYLFGSK